LYLRFFNLAPDYRNLKKIKINLDVTILIVDLITIKIVDGVNNNQIGMQRHLKPTEDELENYKSIRLSFVIQVTQTIGITDIGTDNKKSSSYVRRMP